LPRRKAKHTANELGGEPHRSKKQPNAPALAAEERAVLSVFRRFLMAPNQMLCFSGPDVDKFAEPIAELIEKRLLVAEKFAGGYSLTDEGFAAMKDGGT
jgi:hypothetical protein